MLSRTQVKGLETNIHTLNGCERQLEAVRQQLTRLVDDLTAPLNPENEEMSFDMTQQSPMKYINRNNYSNSPLTKIAQAQQQKVPTQMNFNKVEVDYQPQIRTTNSQYFYEDNNRQSKRSPNQQDRSSTQIDRSSYLQQNGNNSDQSIQINQKSPIYPSKQQYQNMVNQQSPIKKDHTYDNYNVNQSTTTLRTQPKYISPTRPSQTGQQNIQNQFDATPDQVLRRRLQNYPDLDDQQRQKSNFQVSAKTDEGQSDEYSKYINYIKNNNYPSTQHEIINLPEERQSPQKKNDKQFSQIPTYSLFRLLLKEILLLREVEEHKRQLALQHDFNTLDAFRIFDKDGHGKSTPQNFIDGLKELNIDATQIQFNLILKQYSRRNENLLRYSDFIKMLLSSTPDYKVLLQNRAPTFNQSTSVDELFSETTAKYLRDLVQIIIKTEETIEEYKSQISETSASLFEHLDRNNKGFLEESDFRDMFTTYEVHPTALELRRVLMRFNQSDTIYDDQQISLEMFCNQIE